MELGLGLGRGLGLGSGLEQRFKRPNCLRQSTIKSGSQVQIKSSEQVTASRLSQSLLKQSSKASCEQGTATAELSKLPAMEMALATCNFILTRRRRVNVTCVFEFDENMRLWVKREL